MGNNDSLPAADSRPHDPTAKFEIEKLTFERLLPSLLTSHRDLYVAIHGEQVVGSGPDQIEVALDAYRQYGYVPIYVSRVTDQPVAPVRIPSPRRPRSL